RCGHDSALSILLDEFIDLGRGNRFWKTTSENQTTPLPNQLSTGMRGLKPKTVSLDRQAEFVAWQKIELLPQRLGQHHAACFINLNRSILHGIHNTICQIKMEGQMCATVQKERILRVPLPDGQTRQGVAVPSPPSPVE